jgi:hypothetical protein
MFVVPQEVGEGEEGEVVVRSLETGEARQHDHGQKELLYVLDHFLLTNIYRLIRLL